MGAGRLPTTIGSGPSSARGFFVGAAIGTGMTAKAAARGGADFLLALNAGRYRVMGAPSVACVLPIGDNNDVVWTFARSEIVGQVALPVFFGACVLNPALDLGRLVRDIGAAGFHGVCNFPPAVHFDGPLRAVLERAGVGFAREVALMEAARAAGLGTCAYVRRRDEALAMADAGVDILCINYGWNSGGMLGMPSLYSLAEVADETRGIFAEVRQRNPEIVCTVEGGPITTPEEAKGVVEIAQADGYIGGSTIDRIPLETAVAGITSAYKSVAALEQHIQDLKSAWLGDGHAFGLIGRSPAMLEVVRIIRKVAKTDLTVLITGENGTGKELVAQAAHSASGRRDRRMIAVNCAAVPRELLESELFGHEAGAFTGAVKARIGRFEEADGSTLFLDEIADLELPLQAKLLRVLEQGVFERLGANTPRRTNARILCASNRPLARMVREGRFREDLYYRLNVVEIALPPLRDRIDDLPLLVRHMLPPLAKAINVPVFDIDASAYRVLMCHDWPGNVRELRNVLKRALVMCDGPLITATDLPGLGTSDRQPHEAAGTSVMALPEASPESERDWILAALRRNRFRRGDTARELGIARKTLYNKMRRYKLL